MASKLSQVSLTAFGSAIQIACFSKFGSRYYVNLARLPQPSAPLRAVYFPSPNDGVVTLPPCFTNHKFVRYNRVSPPSIRLRHTARAQPSVDDFSPGSPSGDLRLNFESTLRQAIPAPLGDSTSHAGSDAGMIRDTAVEDAPSALDYSDVESVLSPHELENFVVERIPAPSFSPSTPLWAKAATNRLALLGKSGTELVEVQPISYEFGHDNGVA
ncbi:unnamed protein product [Peronospora destructor]|uniref:Uncharacterized protein n=1 Tax=Peronospora destructor TaxID=86335 RepID=A0AAV0TMR6_9STRA|nr:unnamed protein product [Peronospora destructor]